MSVTSMTIEEMCATVQPRSNRLLIASGRIGKSSQSDAYFAESDFKYGYRS